MGQITPNEANGLKREAELSKISLEDGKHKFAEELFNGMGKEMKEYLSNPPKVNEKEERKVEKKRIKREKHKRLKEIFKKLFVC